MKTYKWYWIVMVVMIPIGAQAAEYTLVRGSRFSLCRDLERSLNSFTHPPPMTCGIHFGPTAPKLKLPEWKLIDINRNMDLFKEAFIAEYMNYHGHVSKSDLNKKWETYSSTLPRTGPSRAPKLWIASFDIDHTGDAETVIRLVNDGCEPFENLDSYWSPDPSINVLVDNGRNLDDRYRQLDGYTADPFFYEGRIYLMKWYSGTDYVPGSGAAVGNVGRSDIVNPFLTRGGFGISKALCKLRYFDKE